MGILANLPASEATLATMAATMQAIGSDQTPVPVIANLRSGNRAYQSLGAPSPKTSREVVYSSAFVPSGEWITVRGGLFKTGDLTMGADAQVWLECDLSGGVSSYMPLFGSLRKLADLPGGTGARSWCTIWQVRAGNYRIAIDPGTMTGSTGVTGFTLFASN